VEGVPARAAVLLALVAVLAALAGAYQADSQQAQSTVYPRLSAQFFVAAKGYSPGGAVYRVSPQSFTIYFEGSQTVVLRKQDCLSPDGATCGECPPSYSYTFVRADATASPRPPGVVNASGGASFMTYMQPPTVTATGGFAPAPGTCTMVDSVTVYASLQISVSVLRPPDYATSYDLSEVVGVQEVVVSGTAYLSGGGGGAAVPFSFTMRLSGTRVYFAMVEAAGFSAQLKGLNVSSPLSSGSMVVEPLYDASLTLCAQVPGDAPQYLASSLFLPGEISYAGRASKTYQVTLSQGCSPYQLPDMPLAPGQYTEDSPLVLSFTNPAVSFSMAFATYVPGSIVRATKPVVTAVNGTGEAVFSVSSSGPDTVVVSAIVGGYMCDQKTYQPGQWIYRCAVQGLQGGTARVAVFVSEAGYTASDSVEVPVFQPSTSPVAALPGLIYRWAAVYASAVLLALVALVVVVHASESVLGRAIPGLDREAVSESLVAVPAVVAIAFSAPYAAALAVSAFYSVPGLGDTLRAYFYPDPSALLAAPPDVVVSALLSSYDKLFSYIEADFASYVQPFVASVSVRVAALFAASAAALGISAFLAVKGGSAAGVGGAIVALLTLAVTSLTLVTTVAAGAGLVLAAVKASAAVVSGLAAAYTALAFLGLGLLATPSRYLRGLAGQLVGLGIFFLISAPVAGVLSLALYKYMLGVGGSMLAQAFTSGGGLGGAITFLSIELVAPAFELAMAVLYIVSAVLATAAVLGTVLYLATRFGIAGEIGGAIVSRLLRR